MPPIDDLELHSVRLAGPFDAPVAETKVVLGMKWNPLCRIRRAYGTSVLIVLAAAAAVAAGCGTTVSGESEQAVLESSEVVEPATDSADGNGASDSDDQSLVVDAAEPIDDSGGDADAGKTGAETSTGSQFVAVFGAGTEDELSASVTVPDGWSSDRSSNTLTDGQSTISLRSGCADCDSPEGYDNFFNEIDLDDENLGFGFGFGQDGTTHESVNGLQSDGSWSGQVALSLEGATQFIACTVETVDEASLDVLTEVCESMSIGWPAELIEAAMEDFEITVTDDGSDESGGEAAEIVEKLSDTAAAVVANPAPELPRRDVALELGDDSKVVNVALPADATVGESFFGVEVSLGAAPIFTDIELAATCDGACVPKDWQAALNSADGYLTNQRSSMEIIENDSPIESGWLLSGSGSFDAYTIVVARWNDSADQFMMCEVSVDEDDLGLVDELLGICLSAKPSWF